MALTTNGIYYPTSSDNIAPLESHFATLASSIDANIVKTQDGTTAPFTLTTTVGAATTISISFPTAFASAPNVVGSIKVSTAGSAYLATFFNVTTTGCSVKVTRVYGTSNDGNLFVNWIAKE